ncbi:MAG: right-handed parallel beta-helix repeat-containing protein, partial [Pseudomonadota bacterium]
MMKHISWSSFSKVAFAVAVTSTVPVACILNSADACLEDGTCAETLEPTASGGAGAAGAGTPTTTTANGGAGGTGEGGTGAGGNPTCSTDPDVCDDPALPACSDDGVCVECTPDDAALCDTTPAKPACNPASLACDVCRYHSDCPASACNIFSGECINATPQDVADATALTAAISAPGSDKVLRLAPGVYLLDNVTITNGTVALLAQDPMQRPTLQGTNGGETMQTNAGTVVVIEGINFTSNATPVAAITANGQLALDKVEVRQNAGEGITAGSAAELRIRNSIIAANANNTAAIALGGADLQLLFSAVAGSLGPTAFGITCTPGNSLTIRNSIVFSEDTTAD